MLEASKGEIGECERSVLVDLACEMLKSARKIVLLGRRKLFSPKEVERVITWLGDSLFAKGIKQILFSALNLVGTWELSDKYCLLLRRICLGS